MRNLVVVANNVQIVKYSNPKTSIEEVLFSGILRRRAEAVHCDCMALLFGCSAPLLSRVEKWMPTVLHSLITTGKSRADAYSILCLFEAFL